VVTVEGDVQRFLLERWSAIARVAEALRERGRPEPADVELETSRSK
jgi:hypothetical protein